MFFLIIMTHTFVILPRKWYSCWHCDIKSWDRMKRAHMITQIMVNSSFALVSKIKHSRSPSEPSVFIIFTQLSEWTNMKLSPLGCQICRGLFTQLPTPYPRPCVIQTINRLVKAFFVCLCSTVISPVIIIVLSTRQKPCIHFQQCF